MIWGPPATPIRFEVVYSETANLAYQLDALADRLGNVRPETFLPLWESRFLRTAEDRKALNEWKALRERYAGWVAFPPVTMPLATRDDGIAVERVVQVAELRARSVDAFVAALDGFVPGRDLTRFRDVLTHFQPEFHRWWQAEAAPAGHGFVVAMRRLLSSRQTRDAMERFRRIYDAQVPATTTARFSLIFRNAGTGHTNGEQLGDTAAVEFRAKERPEARIDVILHEFCHFLYGTRSTEADQALQQRFIDSGNPAARSAYNLLNEGMACALGNGIIGRSMTTTERWNRYLSTPRSFYNDDAIDRTGKLLLRLVDAGFALDQPEFVPAYLAAMTDAFHEELRRPRLMLKEAFVLIGKGLDPHLGRVLRYKLRMAKASTYGDSDISAADLEEWRQTPTSSALMIVRPPQLDALVTQGVLKEEERQILLRASETAPVIYARAKSSVAVTYVMVVRNDEEAKQAIDRLNERAAPFDGILPLSH